MSATEKFETSIQISPFFEEDRLCLSVDVNGEEASLLKFDIMDLIDEYLNAYCDEDGIISTEDGCEKTYRLIDALEEAAECLNGSLEDE